MLKMLDVLRLTSNLLSVVLAKLSFGCERIFHQIPQLCHIHDHGKIEEISCDWIFFVFNSELL